MPETQHEKEQQVYIQVTDLLEMLKNNSKNCKKTIVSVFNIEVDTVMFITRLLIDKLEKVIGT